MWREKRSIQAFRIQLANTLPWKPPVHADPGPLVCFNRTLDSEDGDVSIPAAVPRIRVARTMKILPVRRTEMKIFFFCSDLFWGLSSPVIGCVLRGLMSEVFYTSEKHQEALKRCKNTRFFFFLLMEYFE